jgi:endonuclease YncB( thermonuclease family)
VENGYAEVYRGPAKRIDRAPFEAAETRARNSKKGIWSLAKKDRQSPSEYRKELRLREKH